MADVSPEFCVPMFHEMPLDRPWNALVPGQGQGSESDQWSADVNDWPVLGEWFSFPGLMLSIMTESQKIPAKWKCFVFW